MGQPIRKRPLMISLLTMLGILLASTIGSLLVTRVGVSEESVIMVFLLGVLFTTVVTEGYSYGLIASAASVMLFNFFFAEPRYTFVINRLTDVMLLLVFLVTAIVTGTITSRLQKQITISHHNALTARLLYEVSEGFLHVTGKRNIILRGITHIRENTGYCAVVKLTGDETVYRAEAASAGAYTETILSFPIEGVSECLGTIDVSTGSVPPTWMQELILKTVAAQIGIALDREFIYEERENIRITMERERLRSTLLRAVAHDLRSPLTALTGASSLLAEQFDNLTPDEQKKLATDISEEMVWLTNLVENILNMTRISESHLVLHREFEVVDDIVGEARTHMAKLLQNRKLFISLPEDVVSLPVDGKLIVQVIINLLDNAIKHTAPDDSISLFVRAQGGYAVFSITNTGECIDESIKDTLFEAFVTRSGAVADGRRGMGLGLAICKAIVEAHGGTINAHNISPRGTCFTFTLPLEVQEDGKLPKTARN